MCAPFRLGIRLHSDGACQRVCAVTYFLCLCVCRTIGMCICVRVCANCKKEPQRCRVCDMDWKWREAADIRPVSLFDCLPTAPDSLALALSLSLARSLALSGGCCPPFSVYSVNRWPALSSCCLESEHVEFFTPYIPLANAGSLLHPWPAGVAILGVTLHKVL